MILATLLIQGLSLPPLIRALRLDDRDEQLEREETHARLLAAEAALSRIDELLTEDWVREETAERVRGIYSYRHRRFSAQLDAREGSDEEGRSAKIEQRSSDYQRLTRELLDAQRETLLELRDNDHIDGEVMRRIEVELDLEDSRLESTD